MKRPQADVPVPAHPTVMRIGRRSLAFIFLHLYECTSAPLDFIRRDGDLEAHRTQRFTRGVGPNRPCGCDPTVTLRTSVAMMAGEEGIAPSLTRVWNPPLYR